MSIPERIIHYIRFDWIVSQNVFDNYFYVYIISIVSDILGGVLMDSSNIHGNQGVKFYSGVQAQPGGIDQLSQIVVMSASSNQGNIPQQFEPTINQQPKPYSMQFQNVQQQNILSNDILQQQQDILSNDMLQQQQQNIKYHPQLKGNSQFYPQQVQYMPQLQQPKPSISNPNLYYQQQMNFMQQQQIPIQQINSNINYANFQLPTNLLSHYQHKGLTLLNDGLEQDKNKQVVALIVTIHNGGSFDHLFTTVQQKSQQGTRVLVYQAQSRYINKFIKAFEGNPEDQVSKQMMSHIDKLHPDCVVFNWECCSGYSEHRFPEGKQSVFIFLKMILDKGHMAMFSDFSLKALITDWDSKVLGPNPFIQTQQTHGQVQIRFIANQLKQCPSAQLQAVGEMAEDERCIVTTLEGTICYSIETENLKHQHYKLQILSVSTTTIPHEVKYICQVGEYKGSAGHVLLTFPSGGMILTSMGHWIQLMKLEISDNKLFLIAEKEYGQEYASQMKKDYAGLDNVMQKTFISQNAVQFVQNQAPCQNMSKKLNKSTAF